MFVYLLAALFVETLFFVVLSPLLPVYARELHLSRTAAGPWPVFLALSIVIGLLVVCGVVVSAGNEPPMLTRSGGGVSEAIASMRDGLRAPQAGVALAMVALPTVGLGACGVLLPLRLRGLGVAEVVIAVAYLTAAVLEVPTNPLVGRWFDRRGGPLVLRWALLLAAACVTVLALPLPAAALLAALVLAYLVLNACWVPALAQLSTVLERGGAAPGVALGLFNVSWAIFQVVGAIGGAELSRVGLAVSFLVLSVLFLAGARATS